MPTSGMWSHRTARFAVPHPHEEEQPFTRSLDGVKISGTVQNVIIRAHDSTHDYGGKEVTIDLPQ